MVNVAVPATVKFTVIFPTAAASNRKVYTIPTPLSSTDELGTTVSVKFGFAEPVAIIILAKGVVFKVAAGAACSQLEVFWKFAWSTVTPRSPRAKRYSVRTAGTAGKPSTTTEPI